MVCIAKSAARSEGKINELFKSLIDFAEDYDMDYEDVHGFDGEAMLDQIREDYPQCDSGTKEHVYEFVLSQVEKFAQLLHLQGHINETYEQYVQSNEMLTDDSFIDKYFKAAALNLSQLKAALLATCMKTLLKSKSKAYSGAQSKARSAAVSLKAKPTAQQAELTAQPSAKPTAKPTAEEQAKPSIKAEVESDEEADCIFDDSDSEEEEEAAEQAKKKRKIEGASSHNKRQKNVVSKSVYKAWKESVESNVEEYLEAYEEDGQYWATEDLVNALLDGFGTNSDAEFDALAAFLTKKLCGLFDEKRSDKPSVMKKGRDDELEDFLIGLIEYMPFEDF